MRRFGMLLPVLAATAAAGGAAAYEEPRDLSLNAAGVERLVVRTGAGSLRIAGVSTTGTIVAKALIRIPDTDAEEARRIIADDLTLELVRDGEEALLEAQFGRTDRVDGHAGSVTLEVTVPERLALEIDDGSGDIDVRGVHGDIEIDDGSGSIVLAGSGGNVMIDDGSGSLSVEDAGGDAEIDDGSGEIVLHEIGGSVRIDDGSGDITVSGVAGDLEVEEAGSGALDVSDVAGRVRGAGSSGDR